MYLFTQSETWIVRSGSADTIEESRDGRRVKELLGGGGGRIWHSVSDQAIIDPTSSKMKK